MSSLATVVRRARKTKNLDPLIELIPYAQLLGIKALYSDELLFHLPPKNSNVGNPSLPALHGGAIGGFMEMSAALQLLVEADALKVPKVVDFSIDYIRAGRVQDTYASCQVVRQGRKLANVTVQAWQQDRRKSVATARAHFLLE